MEFYRADSYRTARERRSIFNGVRSQGAFTKVSNQGRGRLVPAKLLAVDKMRGRGRPRPILERALGTIAPFSAPELDGGSRRSEHGLPGNGPITRIKSLPKVFMAHIVTDKCKGCKFTDCVEVCPVACFYELDNQVVIHADDCIDCTACVDVIHADDCIDCTACVDVCPVEAIYADASVPGEYQTSIEFNAAEARRLKDSGQEAIVKKKDPLPTAEQRKKELGY